MKCCAHENEIGNFNQTLLPLKNQCQKDIRKMMKDNINPSSFGNIENEDAVLKVSACDQTIRMKTLMFCTMDCVAQKLGMV